MLCSTCQYIPPIFSYVVTFCSIIVTNLSKKFYAYRLAHTSGCNLSGFFFYRCDETFSFKWNSAQAVVSPLRSSKCNMLHFLCVTVAVAMEHEGTNLLARRSGRTARPPFFVCRSKQVHRQGSRIRDLWQWEINNWGGKNAGTVDLIDYHMGSNPVGSRCT